ncbi:hypothetical protein ATJ97_3777 [Georgenia soli]|uniref:Uncharacterized protein n=1 Tax=Georgenia soli TaxID=638953 RepID=A0A2A9ESR4_9MICO|nr:hypothetical protein [Georgenia soli]PFG41229.1 hypothetical protein ATJ97_3777 [Georgenia soli]
MSHHTHARPVTPLRTDEELAEGVYQLLGPALRRQVWLLFLDEESYLQPLLMPCDDLPEPMTPANSLTFGRFAGVAVEHSGASSVVLVVERPSGPLLTEADRGLMRGMHDGCLAAGTPVRAVLLSHRRGVRWVARDDYGF